MKKILITTGAGNTIVGGADIWTNHFINNVWVELEDRYNYILLIDSRKPTNFNDNSLPVDLDFCFYFDDPNFSDKLLNECEEIIFLHSHYHNRPHIYKHHDKFKIIFVHAYASDILKAENELPEINKSLLQTNIDSDFYDAFLSHFKTLVWIGNNYSTLYEKRFKNVLNIPNFYEFEYNLSLTGILNRQIGFASRNETRKCFHWLDKHDAIALTDKRAIQNLKDTTNFDFSKIKTYQWDPAIQESFMKKKWGIFHGAYIREPFGYSIFQAVDYGKLPILYKDWGIKLDYKYRVSNKQEFDECVETIYNDSYVNRLEEWSRLKEYLKTFDNKKLWVERIKSVI